MFGGAVPVAFAAEEGISVHLAPYVLGTAFGVPITATIATAWLAMFVLIAIAVTVFARLSSIPGKFQSSFELMIGGAYDYVADVLGDPARARMYFPVIMTIFVFVLTMNWLGLFPGVTSVGFFEGHGADAHFTPLFYPPAADLNITVAIAIVAFFTIEIAGVLAIGFYRYAGKFFNFSSPLAFAIGIIEFMSELARLISFSFRLFGNIFAGKVMLLVIMFLATPYVLPVPLMAYELFVGLIQAFIFAILTLYFIKLATEEPH